MDKNEILEKSRQENNASDERYKFIEAKAYQNSHRAVLFLNLTLASVACIQDLLTGQPFADPHLFFSLSMLSETIKYGTFYRYYQDKKYLKTGLTYGLVTVLFLLILILDYFV